MSVFLNLLTPVQQGLFLELARAMAEADGVFDPSEELLLGALLAECGSADVPGARELDEVLSAVSMSFVEAPAKTC